ncbi:amyloid fiber anchoring/assembly protein TapA [Oceanobacillus sp. Castelsardo]|uniref:amyloid fiber anchoring/assembly protein TapA n=1 Tax=Oceanobacillus sp. Castelsardo TaxID=1851204 RepID=UPI000838E099|nr:amyloid fiber anchoring/assembly protein TapA [Oceanobacillus sp. Castelsardo]
MSRLKKFKSKYRGFWLIAKIAMIWYLLLFSATYFTSTTSAVFSSKVAPKGSIEASDWLKGQYELQFDMSGNPHRTCSIETTVKNTGPGDMEENVKFDVFYVENGNPVKGEKVGEGRINALKSEESAKVSYEANKTGKYVFIVDEKDIKVESKKFNVECNPNNEKVTNSEQKTEENNNVNKEPSEKVIENIDEQVKKEDETKSVEPKQQEKQVKEEKPEKSAEPEQSPGKPVEQRSVQEQKPVEEEKQKEEEMKPEIESNPKQENKEGA